MKVYILERNKDKVQEFKKIFAEEEDVEVVCKDFISFMASTDVECVVSPANAYGIMDGGYDEAITDWYGEGLMQKVQRYILDNYFGEQPVGTSFLLEIGNGQKLIHTPTMKIPSKIKDPFVVYQCMRTTLMCAVQNNVQSIVIPVFGGATGGVDALDAAKLMWLGYYQIHHPNTEINWDIVRDIEERWKCVAES